MAQIIYEEKSSTTLWFDTDAMWEFSHTKGSIFGYKLHLISSIGSSIVPLTANFSTGNIPDNQM